MGSAECRWDYTARLNRVVNYIGEHLDEPLTLRELADEAAFSPFHFHRIFKAMMGETLGGFFWRLRLEKAANLLLWQPTARITDVALACGFSSPSNFSRAFRQRFGMSATEFRAGGLSKMCKAERKPGEVSPMSALYAPSGGPTAAQNPERSGTMNVEVKTLPGYRVAYVRRFGYSKGVFQEHLSAAFQQACRWVSARGLFGPETLVIGVPHDNPDVTPNARCRYDACVTVPREVPGGTGDIDVQELAGGTYAMQRIDVDDPAEIGRLVDAMYGQWLPASGYQADDRPPLEIYRDSGEPSLKTRIVLDFCIPVKAL
jgi:AraC family transcriptional regulator